jgi:hypothetical protein
MGTLDSWDDLRDCDSQLLDRGRDLSICPLTDFPSAAAMRFRKATAPDLPVQKPSESRGWRSP